MRRFLAGLLAAALSAALSFGAAAQLSPWLPGLPSTLTLPSATATAYSAGQLIANSPTAASVVVPFFTIPAGYKSALIARVRLDTNDPTSTAWPSVAINVDLWSCAPTFTNGDRGAFSPATGTGCHLATFNCTMSAEYGDGAYAECAISAGNFSLSNVAPNSKVYWTLEAIGASGLTKSSTPGPIFTMTPEITF
jgi:hypothetical protein